MSRKRGGFFGWLRKLFSRSKCPEPQYTSNYSHSYKSAPVQQYHQQQQHNSYGQNYYTAPAGYTTEQSAFHQRADEIAQIQVAGIRRTAGNGYVQAYSHRAAGPDPDAITSRPYDQTTVSSYGTNGKAWDDGKYEKQPQANSAWRGKPVGKQYDRREELTEEDEDMWARMAM